MFEQLPRLFDRNFLLGYFVPVTIFLGFALAVLAPLRGLGHIFAGIEKDPSIALVYGLVLSAIIAYMLFSVNRFMIIFTEGYYFPLNSLSCLKTRQLRRRNSLVEDLGKIVSEGERARKQYDLINYFPPLNEDVQPTRFGNVLSAYEAYPIEMYGIDIIPGWYHILDVTSDAMEQRILSDKSLVDFYLNLTWLSFGALPLIVIRTLHDIHVFRGSDWMEFALHRWWHPVAFIGVLLLASVFYNAAIAAAVVWGTRVKVTFNLYTDDLARKLGYEPPLSRDVWQQIMRAFIYKEKLPPKKVPGTPAPPPSGDVHAEVRDLLYRFTMMESRFSALESRVTALERTMTTHA